jgi:chromosome partitioning protein
LIQGILLTRYHTRTILNRDMGEIIEDTAKQFKTSIYKTFIRESVVVREAQAKRKDLFTYAPKSNPAKDYLAFTKEVIERSKADE